LLINTFPVNLPPLCTPRDVGSRILLQQRTDAAKAAAESVAMDMESDSEKEEEEEEEAAEEAANLQQRLNITEKQHTGSAVTQPAPAAPIAGNVVIRDYDPKKGLIFYLFYCKMRNNLAKAKAQQQEKFIISPLTNERIPADKLHEHVRYNTVDPQFKEQRDRYISFFIKRNI
jgi:splicing factor 3A subunit 1